MQRVMHIRYGLLGNNTEPNRGAGKRPKSPIYTYKGWGIKSLPESKTKERGQKQ